VLPDDIFARSYVDWSMLGGTQLAVKLLGYFDTTTLITIYFLWNEAHAPTLLEELKAILNSISHYALQFRFGNKSHVFQVKSQNNSTISLSKRKWPNTLGT
jgi:hypothetical protein